jgi:hypothetical protein
MTRLTNPSLDRSGTAEEGDRMRPALILGFVLALVGGCATSKESFVAQVAPRGSYLDASFAASSGVWRFLFPASAECAAVLKPEAPVIYNPGGIWGRFHGPDGAVCEPAGIGNLERWRRSRVEGEGRPSSPARWEIAHRDKEVLLLRGRFALASRVGLAGTFDIVAMVANDDTCRAVAESGAATLVFRQSGRPAFLLGQCPVLAFARPL